MCWMWREIGDKASIMFSVGFYQALGAGRSVNESYDLGCVQIRLQGISGKFVPVLYKRDEGKTISTRSSTYGWSQRCRSDGCSE